MAESADQSSGRFRSQALPARLISGILLAGVTLGSAWVGGWVFGGLVFVLLMIALWEFLRMATRAGFPVLMTAGLVSGASVLMLAFTHDARNAGVVLVSLALWMFVQSLRPPIQNRAVALALTLTGVLYVTGLGLHVLWIRQMDQGLQLLAVVFLGTWAADTFAFFVGVRFGKTPLAPEISPGKSVEGFVGSVLGSALVVVLASRWLVTDLALIEALLVGLVLGILSPLGDLLESMCKRNFQIKDSSRVIPGHGGVLDRIDSLLITAPFGYYLFRILLS